MIAPRKSSKGSLIMVRASLPALKVAGRSMRVVGSFFGPKTMRFVDTGNASSTGAHSPAPKDVGTEHETSGIESLTTTTRLRFCPASNLLLECLHSTDSRKTYFFNAPMFRIKPPVLGGPFLMHPSMTLVAAASMSLASATSDTAFFACTTSMAQNPSAN